MLERESGVVLNQLSVTALFDLDGFPGRRHRTFPHPPGLAIMVLSVFGYRSPSHGPLC